MLLVITPAERQALQMLADGRAMHAVADHLSVGGRETAARLSTLFSRMGASSRADAVAAASRRGLLTYGDRRTDHN